MKKIVTVIENLLNKAESIVCGFYAKNKKPCDILLSVSATVMMLYATVWAVRSGMSIYDRLYHPILFGMKRQVPDINNTFPFIQEFLHAGCLFGGGIAFLRFVLRMDRPLARPLIVELACRLISYHANIIVAIALSVFFADCNLDKLCRHILFDTGTPSERALLATISILPLAASFVFAVNATAGTGLIQHLRKYLRAGDGKAKKVA